MATVTEADTPDKFYNTVDNWVNITFVNINLLIKQISSTLFERIILDTPVLTGRARNNWVFSAGNTPEFKDVGPKKRKGQKAPEFDKSGREAVNKANNGLRRAAPMIKKKTSNVDYYLTNQVPYITKLEYGGHSKQALNGMARKNVQKIAHMTISQFNKSRGKI